MRVGYDRRRIELLPRCRIGGGAGRLEQVWRLLEQDGRPTLVIGGEEGVICKLYRRDDGAWRGRWLAYEGMPVELTPTSAELPTLTDTATDVAHEPIDAVYTSGWMGPILLFSRRCIATQLWSRPVARSTRSSPTVTAIATN